MSREVDVALEEADALVLEAGALRVEPRRGPPGAVDDAVAGDAIVAAGVERPADLPRPARRAQKGGDLTVRRDTSGRDATD